MNEWLKTVMKLRESEAECVTVEATPEELYGLFHFCECQIAERLREGMVMDPAEMYKTLRALYALRDATLKLQDGEQVLPPA